MLLMKKSGKAARSKGLAALDLKVRYQNVEALKPYAGNARTHWSCPGLVDSYGLVIRVSALVFLS